MPRPHFVLLTVLLLAVAAPLAAQGRPQAPSSTVPRKKPTGTENLAVEGFGPNGATIRCRNGTHPAPGAADSACEGKGGVAMRYPIRRYYDPNAPENRAAAQPGAASTRSPAAGSRPARAATPPVRGSRPAGFESNAEYRARMAAERSARRAAPAGATLLCNDGTFVVRDTVPARCAAKGGVKLRLSQPRSAQ